MQKNSSFKTLFGCLLFTLLPGSVQAFKLTPEICKEYGLGSNWYCSELKSNEEQEVTPEDILASDLAPEVQAEVMGAFWDKSRKRAVMTGKQEDVELFLKYQHAIARLGVDFARKAQALAESTPSFANSESNYKNSAMAAVKEATQRHILARGKKRYALVFVYHAECPYCLRQLPIIQEFAHTSGYKVLGVTPDKEHLPGLESVTDPQISQDPGILAFPTMLLLDIKKGKKIFISKGVTTLDDIERLIVDRISEIEGASHEEGN
jgi:conjugal transfer pilus assembly protein TraF